MSFGHHAREGEAEWRRDQIAAFARFCKKQRARLAVQLDRRVERIADAKWKAVDGEELTLVEH